MKRNALLCWEVVLCWVLLTGPAMADQIRKPAVAGLFYPGEKKELASLVDGYLEKAPLHPCAEREILALIVPHAGYLYSGRVAAQAYKQIQGKSYEAVVLIGPSHSAGFEGASLYDGDFYETPLGKVRINKALTEELIRQNKGFCFLPQPHRKEHSLEVQLPFLQRSLADFSLVPILIGSQSLSTSKALSGNLIQVLKGKKVLLVASSDLSHYHPAKVAHQLDQSTREAIQAMDAPGLIRRVEAGSAELCGVGAVATVLLAAKGLGASQAEVLSYVDSGEVTGDSSAVVGYLAAALSKDKGAKTSPSSRGGEGSLSPKLQQELLGMARQAIETYLVQGKILQPQASDPALDHLAAAFVTLTPRGELRGCIGLTEPLFPLSRTVTQCAIAAATSDPRFPPLKASEFQEVEIEISVLSPLREIKDPTEIKVGRDGILIEKKGRRGLLLPQVATEYHWDRKTFLEETCHKAGLPADAWKEGARIFIFSAEIFHEGK